MDAGAAADRVFCCRGILLDHKEATAAKYAVCSSPRVHGGASESPFDKLSRPRKKIWGLEPGV